MFRSNKYHEKRSNQKQVGGYIENILENVEEGEIHGGGSDHHDDINNSLSI